MNELVKIEVKDGQQLVSGRELHEKLEIGTPYKKWFDRMKEYDFIENKDFFTVGQKSPIANGGFQEITEHLLTIPMAKELCMIQRNEKGKELRQYFIKCEEAWNSPEMILARANQIQARMIEQHTERIKVLENKIEEQEQIIGEFKPMKDYVDTILSSEDTITTSQIAADYGLTGIALNKILHDERMIRNVGGQWLLYKEHMNKGYTKSDTIIIKRKDGTDKPILTTKWTQKGRLKIHEILTTLGIQANIDKEKTA